MPSEDMTGGESNPSSNNGGPRRSGIIPKDHRRAQIVRMNTSINSPSGAFDIVDIYNRILNEDPEITMPVAAIEALLEVLINTNASTVSEFMDILQRGSLILQKAVPNSFSLSAGCNLFQRFVTRSWRDVKDFEETKSHLIANGQLFIHRAREAREKIAETGSQFIRDGATILIHSYSRVVLAVLLKAASKNVRFKVYITESRPNGSGLRAKQVLENSGIPTCMILDCAVGYTIQKVDLVLVGAEGVVENGGLINQVGTMQVAALAKFAHKPFYAVAESHKFVRLYPLSQYDLPTTYPVLQFSEPELTKSRVGVPPRSEDEGIHRRTSSEETVLETSSPSVAGHYERSGEGGQTMTAAEMMNNPQLDLTAPDLITGLITDLGVLNPLSGVSEELIKLYL